MDLFTLIEPILMENKNRFLNCAMWINEKTIEITIKWEKINDKIIYGKTTKKLTMDLQKNVVSFAIYIDYLRTY